MYIYICTHNIYIYIYIHVYIYIHIYFIYKYSYVFMYLQTYMYVPMYMYKYIYVRIYMCLACCVSITEWFKDCPEHLQKEINKIFALNCENQFSDPFLIWYKIPLWFVFRTCFASAIFVMTRGTCKSSRRSTRRLPGVESVTFMDPDLQSPRHLAQPLRNELDNITRQP